MLIVLLPIRPLWLDEIIQLIGTRSTGLTQLLHYVANDPGQAPLAYLLQSGIIHCFGYSLYTARALSVLASILSCAGMAQLGRKIELKYWVLPPLIFALVPLQLRYALEARPYELALLLAIFATILALNVAEQHSFKWICCYTVVICLGVLTQPYFVFVPAAHVLWVCVILGFKHPSTIRFGIAFCVMLVFYLPWYIETKTVLMSPGIKSYIGLKTPLVVFRELVGGGYPASFGILCCIALVLKSHQMSRSQKIFWSFLVMVPLLGPLLVDVLFSHFVANRQTIFIIPALTCFLAVAFEGENQAGHFRRALPVLLLGVFFISDGKFFVRRHEDWQQAAEVLSSGIQNTKNACIAFVPKDSIRYYTFFNPKLSESTCEHSSVRSHRPILAAISPYDGTNDYERLRESIDKEPGENREFVLRADPPRIVKLD